MENLVPGMSLDLWKFELSIIRIHAFDFLACWSAKDLDNLHKLIHSTLTRK
eukprot:Gb_01804 [translate_table: standard]